MKMKKEKFIRISCEGLQDAEASKGVDESGGRREQQNRKHILEWGFYGFEAICFGLTGGKGWSTISDTYAL